jgi:transmembrane sensor
LETRYTPEQFAILLQSYIDNRYSIADVDQLLEMIEDPAYEGLALEMIDGTINKLRQEQRQLDDAVLQRLYERLPNVFGEEELKETKTVSLFYRIRWVAAAVFLIVISTTYLFITKKENKPALTSQANVSAPDRNKARITLSNGKTIYLDSVSNGKTIDVDGVQLTKLADGRIVYGGDANTVVYNTASNPRGSTVIDLELNDHTHVWLNAGSSITYPVVFNGSTRKVTITGEAYFEVKHDASKPFIVNNGATNVQVLGTHFNVKAYYNEPDEKVTLLEGKVKVTNSNKEQLLAPNQQAIISAQTITLATDANLDDVMAWKKGFTSYHGVDMKVILRELERWYDITTEMKKEIRTTRVIDVPRSVPLKDMLKTLLDDNGIVYEYDATNKKLTILP